MDSFTKESLHCIFKEMTDSEELYSFFKGKMREVYDLGYDKGYRVGLRKGLDDSYRKEFYDNEEKKLRQLQNDYKKKIQSKNDSREYIEKEISRAYADSVLVALYQVKSGENIDDIIGFWKEK